jgi:hypothetical protein
MKRSVQLAEHRKINLTCRQSLLYYYHPVVLVLVYHHITGLLTLALVYRQLPTRSLCAVVVHGQQN